MAVKPSPSPSSNQGKGVKNNKKKSSSREAWIDAKKKINPDIASSRAKKKINPDVASSRAKKATVKKADNWANDMTRQQKSVAKKAFSRGMSYGMGRQNDVTRSDAEFNAYGANERWNPASTEKRGRSLMKASMKNAAKATKNPSNMKKAKSVGYTKAAAVRNYAAATRRSTNRKRGE